LLNYLKLLANIKENFPIDKKILKKQFEYVVIRQVIFMKINLEEIFNKLNSLSVLLIGEAILDEYYFVKTIGIASKDPIISTQFQKKEKYLGGIFAPARHLSNFVKKVHIVTLLGEYKRNENYIKKRLDKENIKYDFFTKIKSPTIIKRRYLESHHFRKLFKMEYSNTNPISRELKKKIKKRIGEIIPNYDLIIVSDFGQGFINSELIDYFSKQNKFIAINVQTNSSNFGFNTVMKYPKADFLSLNEMELRIIYQNKNEEIYKLLERLHAENEFSSILLTLGKRGCYYYKDKLNYSKAFITNPVDTIGAGDAVFSFSSLLSFLDIDQEYVPKFANAVGACVVETLGNKESITKNNLLKYLEVKNIEMG